MSVAGLARATLQAVVAGSLLLPVTDLDQAVRERVQAGRRAGLEPVMRAATSIGRPPVVLGTLLVFATLGGAPGVALARTVLAAAVPTNLVVEGLKRLTHRARPDGSLDADNTSFPSSHAANAFALAVVLASRWRRGALAFLLAAGIVAFSRMYLDRHFLSDVLFGSAVGAGCAVLAVMWARGRGRRFVRWGLAAGHDGEPRV